MREDPKRLITANDLLVIVEEEKKQNKLKVEVMQKKFSDFGSDKKIFSKCFNN
jgi:hypothetical protein